ncbi:general substrate transporter [Pseudomassariella vexata]|uniref:General substrate transporter n=1 Tax=Pseudomassariella vexata TaxID=1141098 RepID=A0A1Y2ECY5_9PEZI|nr:general substrate transporter [Pseudomassariella vexata]ORY69116.1 general substrate transporter [Pseudomassariella vexata]
MPFPPSQPEDSHDIRPIISKKHEIVLFSSTAIALYGYDQGMMSLVNTNRSYLRTMQIAETSPMVGIIVSIYYLGCTVGAVVASFWADKKGRKPSIFACLATCMVGNILMFVAGLSTNGSDTWGGAALAFMLAGRVILGLGVGGIDAVIPIYSSELSKDEARGRALAQEFQMNIFGLLMAFAINLGVTIALGKDNQWAWRIPIVVMQIFPILLISIMGRLPETPRWLIRKERKRDARKALVALHGESKAEDMLDELHRAQEEESDEKIRYMDMLVPGGSQFHPSMVTVMGQINQALTGYGAVSVYGPQIFELLGFGVREAEYVTLGNYISYFFMMTVAWMSIDVLGRRKLMVWGSLGLASCFALLTVFGGLSLDVRRAPVLVVEILGSVTLFVATAIFGICWLATVWLIPTEIYPSGARAQGSAISVIIWGLANFTITLLTPIGFNNLKYWLFLVFAVTNTFAGWWTWRYSPETGGRSFEENQEFFLSAQDDKSWVVKKVDAGKFLRMPREEDGEGGKATSDENAPLLASNS